MLLAVVVASSVWLVAFRTVTPPDPGRDFPEPKSGITNSTPTPVPWETTLEDVLPRLAKKNRPFTVVLIGDSTGVDPAGWNVRLMDWLSERTNRPWEMHAWHQEPHPEFGPPGYFPPWPYFDERPNAPIVLWNASAGGKGWDYTAANKAEMFPRSLRSVDLLLVNHGHNVRPGTDYYDHGYKVLDDLRNRFPKAAAVLFKQNPEKGASLTQTVLPEVFRQVDRYKEWRPGVTVIDVHRAFEDTGKPLALIDDTNFHPTKPGYQMWFELVRDELVRASPRLGR